MAQGHWAYQSSRLWVHLTGAFAYSRLFRNVRGDVFCSQRSICPCRRYGSKVAALRQTFSEYGLIKFRVLVECRWLQQLSAIPEVTEVPAFSQEATAALDLLASSFDVQDALAVKKVCHVCEHNMATYSCEQF